MVTMDSNLLDAMTLSIMMEDTILPAASNKGNIVGIMNAIMELFVSVMTQCAIILMDQHHLLIQLLLDPALNAGMAQCGERVMTSIILRSKFATRMRQCV